MNSKTKKTLLPIITILILIALIILAIYIINLREYKEATEEGNIYVSKVIDGDTFEMSDNTIIRLLCVDTPERGKSGYSEAKDFLEDMILNKEVRLEKDMSEEDEYGRLLRYVYVNISNIEMFVNKQIVQEDYGKIFRYGNDTSRCDEIEGI